MPVSPIPGLEIADLIRGMALVCHLAKSLVDIGVQRIELGQPRCNFHVLVMSAVDSRLAEPFENQVKGDVFFGSRKLAHRGCHPHQVIFASLLSFGICFIRIMRTYRSLNKDAPVHRAIESRGAIIMLPVLGGLHHQYCRI